MMFRGLFGSLLSIACLSPLHAQVILEIESRDHRVTPSRTETTFVVSDGRQLATGLTSGNSTAEGGMIYRSSRRELVVLNHRDQSYMTLDAQTTQRLAGQLNQLTGGQMSGRAAPRSPAQVKRTADFAPCFGFPATRCEVWRDGRLVREMYVTDWQNVDGGREVAAVFADMGKFLELLMATLPSGGGANELTDENYLSEMSQLEGFPVGVRAYRSDGTLEREWALRSARRQRVDPTTFSPPSGYRQQGMPGS